MKAELHNGNKHKAVLGPKLQRCPLCLLKTMKSFQNHKLLFVHSSSGFVIYRNVQIRSGCARFCASPTLFPFDICAALKGEAIYLIISDSGRSAPFVLFGNGIIINSTL